MKKLLTGLMAVVMMAGLAGCGSKDDGAGEGSDTAKKELTVYTNSGYKPYEMVDEKGNLYGFDIDVMNEAAKLAGYTVKWEDVDFDGIIRELNAMGYEGPLSVEWEDSGMERECGARESLEYIKKMNFSPSNIAFDSALQRN